MKKLTSKLQRTAVSIGFINNVIHNKVIPKFTEVKEHFINNNDKHDSEMKILQFHLIENKRNLRSLTSKLQECEDNLIIIFGKIFTSILEYKVIKINRSERIKKSFKTKNKRLTNFY